MARCWLRPPIETARVILTSTDEDWCASWQRLGWIALTARDAKYWIGGTTTMGTVLKRCPNGIATMQGRDAVSCVTRHRRRRKGGHVT